ncbi:MAG: Holliday junction branch migration protein RuvA [SAR324 cluster bacterium]|nr:Holliday junction branch migration protein RuvA [SAR324 cluster bacterium]
MISYLEGIVLDKEENAIILKTTGGIGYQVFVSKTILDGLRKNDELKCFIYTNVREDEISLYGFLSLGEKQLFELLLHTSGVGPRLALTILSNLSPLQLIQAIQQDDVQTLSTIPGIGKKTAGKLCLDMKDLLKKHPVSGTFADSEKSVVLQKSSEQHELVSALSNMGFHEKSIMAVLAQIPDNLSFEEKLRKALPLLASFR